ncbi:hypothetical protein M406DRAFT_16211, partial [Cryphonectria parasitica EP155]
VSSKHLTVACPRFDKMLSGDWMEAKQIYLDGCRHVDLEGNFDPAALGILLNVLHGKTRIIPKTLDLDMLTKVAVLVDDFGCNEAIQIWSDLWIQKLEIELPMVSEAASEEYLKNWIVISAVFGKPSVFRKATQLVLLHGSDSINSSGLPIPATVDESINSKRIDLIQQLLDVLYNLIDTLNGNDGLYSGEHRCVLLGALLRQMTEKGIPWTRPDAPFSGFSFEHLAKCIIEFWTP